MMSLYVKTYTSRKWGGPLKTAAMKLSGTVTVKSPLLSRALYTLDGGRPRQYVRPVYNGLTFVLRIDPQPIFSKQVFTTTTLKITGRTVSIVVETPFRE